MSRIKHLVVSRRDAHFNDAYFPARVGRGIRFLQTPLLVRDIDSTIKNDTEALPDARPIDTESAKKKAMPMQAV